MPKIVCLGILVADVVGKSIDALPEKGTLAAVERMELHVGGCAANTAMGLAKLGVSVGIQGKIGRDGFGEFLSGSLTNAGVETECLTRDSETSTSATMVTVHSDGERSFLHHPGANAAFTEDDIDWPQIENADILHVAGPFLMPEFIGENCANVLKHAKELGKTTTLDTVWDFTDRWMDVLKPSLPYLDYLLPSLEEAKKLTGRETPRDIAQTLLDAGVKVVGLKLGDAGCYVQTSNGDTFQVPIFPVTAIDFLGAGDAWAAGFLTGLTHKWPLEKCARFANAVGACCVEKLGATPGIRSFDATCALAFGPSS